MADKLRPGIKVRTSFVDGEGLKAAKLNSLSAQLQTASQNLESALGDIHDESYPYSSNTSSRLSPSYGTGLAGAATRSLDIANLGRLIGPASNLNPHILGSRTITEAIPEGVHEFSLEYPPNDPTDMVFSDAVVFANLTANPQSLIDPGDYYTDNYGRVYTVSLTLADATVQYLITPDEWTGLAPEGASFNVIPDLNQLAVGDGCTIGAIDGDGKRQITLPTVTHHAYNEAGTDIELTAADAAFEQQLLLPQVLVDSWTVGEEIPGGFLYLKNYTKGVIYSSATYYYNDSTSVLIGGFDITEDVDDGDKFCIITVGCDITSSIDDLRRRTRHSHDRTRGEPGVLADALAGILALETPRGWYGPSEIPGNKFPQYLHRDGYDPDIDDGINDNNILRGDLGLGKVGATAGQYRAGSSDESYRVRLFNGGDPVGGQPYEAIIYKDIDGHLVLRATESSAYGVVKHVKTETILEPSAGMKTEDFTQVTGESDWAIKPFVVTLTEQDFSSTLFIPFVSTYGFNDGETVLSVSVLATDSGLHTTWYPPSEDSGRGYYFAWADGALAGITVVPTGSLWGDADMRVVIWYSK